MWSILPKKKIGGAQIIRNSMADTI